MQQISDTEMEQLKTQVNRIADALLGDGFGNKGIVERLKDVEKEADLSKQFRQKAVAGLSFLVACGAILAWIGDKLIDLFKHKQ